MLDGTIKWYNSDKGYGFIQPDKGGADVFVHAIAVEFAGIRQLSAGQALSYEVMEQLGELSATDLHVL